MNIVTKVMLAGGFLLVVIGTIIGMGGFAELDEHNKKIQKYISDEDNNITKEFTDADGQGSAGWYIMVQGEYLDENSDNRADACENMTFSITDGEGNNVTEVSGQFDCKMDDDWTDEYLDPIKDDGWIVVAYVCATISEDFEFDCDVGESYTISSNKNMKLYDADAKAIVDVEIFFGTIILQAGGASCIGCCLLVIGGIMALTMRKPSQVVVYQQGAAATNPNQTHMSQPVLEQQHESYEPPAQSVLQPPSGGL
jgi:hypothetical protein